MQLDHNPNTCNLIFDNSTRKPITSRYKEFLQDASTQLDINMGYFRHWKYLFLPICVLKSHQNLYQSTEIFKTWKLFSLWDLTRASICAIFTETKVRKWLWSFIYLFIYFLNFKNKGATDDIREKCEHPKGFPLEAPWFGCK